MFFQSKTRVLAKPRFCLEVWRLGVELGVPPSMLSQKVGDLLSGDNLINALSGHQAYSEDD